ncbi:MAG: LCP family protein, partial [Clostridiaceae bacterium]|nr:LCP family protein [Clostridiaceae bacterium]
MKKNQNDKKEAERSTPTPASQQEERQPVRNVRLRFGSSGAADADDIRRIVAKSARKSEHETRRPAPLKTKDTQTLVRPRGLRQRIAVFLRNRQRRKARRKISPTVRMVRRVALILAILLVVLAGLGYAAVTYALSLIQRPGPTTHTVRPGMTAPSAYTTRPTHYKPPEFKGIQNILLLGVDDRREVDGETYNNSDVMMIVTVDMDNKTVKLTSLQRDMAVYIPGYGIHKLTDSHGYGGADLTMQTINENLRLSLTDYVAVDINESERLIDLVGGVDLYVEEEILWYVNECIGNQNLWFPDYGESPYLTQGGMQHLDGRQAVGYARVRSYDSDYKRMGRQREVLQAVFDAFMESSLPQKITMITEGLKCIYTTLSDAEIRKLAVNIAPSMKNEIIQKQVPDPTKYGVEFIESSDFMIRADFNGIIPGLYAFLFNDPLLPFDPPLEVPGAPNAAQGLPPGLYDQWKGPQSTSSSTT